MPDVTHRCPSCESPLTAYDTVCNACDQVVGADNLCPHCQALAPVEKHAGQFVCSACGEPRNRHVNTALADAESSRQRLTRERLRAQVYSTMAAISALIGLGVAGLVGLYGQNGFEIGLAMLVCLVLLSFAGLLARKVSRTRLRTVQRERFMLSQRLLGFARRQAGTVTAEQVAQSLNISVPTADAMLEGLVRTDQAEMEITERGEIQFTIKLPHQTQHTVHSASLQDQNQGQAGRTPARISTARD